MDSSILKEILIPISTIVTLLSVAIGSLIAVFSYRINLRAETRLKESAKAEINAKLLGLMVNLMQTANGRSGYEVSNEAISKILDSENINSTDFLNQDNIKVINKILQETAVITLPVGAGEQDFAIKAIAELGIQHSFLKEIAKTSIVELSKIPRAKDLCDKLITTLNQN